MYLEQTVIAAISTVFALLKENNRVSIIQERKINVLYSCYTRVLTVDFYLFFEELLRRTLTLELFGPCL